MGCSGVAGRNASAADPMLRGRRCAAAGLAILVTCSAGIARGESHATGELVDRSAFRVCADPAYMPYSNDRGEGFENRIAELLAAQLDVPLTYTWHPRSQGFVRNTLRARNCDVIMGVVTADELVQNTNPYYRSSYVLVQRTADGGRYGPDLDDPAMRGARIGVVAGTPPADLLARAGLLDRVRPYQLLVDPRYDNPVAEAIADLAAGEIDVALLWGPIAGYWAKQSAVPLSILPLASDRREGLQMDFRISLGIRQGEPTWKHEIERLLREL
jgi:quinoprotein dehydrogenase-associated probable ABC transporter substrate-binding protein